MDHGSNVERRAAEIVSLTAQIRAATSVHNGKHNRLFGRRESAMEAIDGQPDADSIYRALFARPEPAVRQFIAWRCWHRRKHVDQVMHTMRDLGKRTDEIGREARKFLAAPPEPITRLQLADGMKSISFAPPPRGCTRVEAESAIRKAIGSEPASAITTWLRRSIRLWPQRLGSTRGKSQFGGVPLVPPGWSWPFEFDEPKLFLAQIDCAEVRTTTGASALPERGLLSFFGDIDDVNGCGPTGESPVFYFPDMAALRPAPLPLHDFQPLIGCSLAMYESWDIPDFQSDAVDALGLSPEDADRYFELWQLLSRWDTLTAWREDFPLSKLFGWPDLVQRDLGDDVAFPKGVTPQLLLQIGWYHDGLNWESWGPGGTLYFILTPETLAVGRFELAELEVQCT